MKNRTKRIGVIASLLSLLAGTPAMAEGTSGFVKWVQPKKASEAYVEPNLFYEMPKGINGYTWMEFYQNEKGYYGESNFDKEIPGIGTSLASQIAHWNDLFSRIGTGVSADVPKLPDWLYAKVTVLPFWFDINGNRKNESEIGYFVEAQLPLGFKASSFGNLNLSDPKGTQWGYGEIDFGRNVIGDRIKLGYNPALLNDGNARPKIQHRVAASANFKF